MIGGFQKTSLVDFPGLVSSTIFLRGCNMRCQYCHNRQLIDGPSEHIPFDNVLKYLEDRKGLIKGVCISGGEPTLSDLSFIKELKCIGLKIKMDTNGTNPDVIREVLPLVDYIAVDIKAPLEKYKEITQTKIDITKILETITIVKNIPHEFRTTIQPDLLSPDDIAKIAKIVQGSTLVLQNFRPAPDMFNPNLQKTYTRELAQKILERCEEYTPTFLRGF